MKKKIFRPAHLLLLLSIVLVTISSSCSKDDSPSMESKEYSLTYLGAEVGKVLIKEKADGNASLKITLIPSAVVPNVSSNGSIQMVEGGAETGQYATLTCVCANATISDTDPVLSTTIPITPIPYDTLVSKTGYIVKVTYPSNVEYRAVL